VRIKIGHKKDREGKKGLYGFERGIAEKNL
jgi:hypothetical protein